jgi:hypothetical protein
MSAPVTIPNAVPENLLRGLEANWPAESSDVWHRYSGTMGDKLATLHWQCLPAEAWPVLCEIGSIMECYYKGCVIDWRLHGAGLHQINPGGCLPRHLDGEIHPRTRLSRWLSAVLFLGTAGDGDGGELVIEGKATIRPQRGLLAIFETPQQWHEVRPTNIVRRTVALFGYRPGDGHGRISALFQGVSQ